MIGCMMLELSVNLSCLLLYFYKSAVYTELFTLSVASPINSIGIRNIRSHQLFLCDMCQNISSTVSSRNKQPNNTFSKNYLHHQANPFFVK